MIETARLLLRPPMPEDLDALAEIYADPQVMRFIGKGVRTRAETEAAIERMRAGWAADRHGLWLAFHRDGGALVGRIGLSPLENTGEVELGYLLARRFWNLGLATEGARASLAFGFRDVGLERIVAIAHHDNRASRHVLDKLGMRYRRDAFHYGIPVAYYDLSRADFERPIQSGHGEPHP